jgi:hypothetical protein
MGDIRKIIIIFVVAILFAVLVFSVIEAVYPQPKYEDHCRKEFFPRAEPIGIVKTECEPLEVPSASEKACQEKNGVIRYERDSNGCAVSFECSTCDFDYDAARDRHSQYVFYISAFLSLVAIFIGLYLPAKGNTLNEWIGTGFMLGGAIALFFGTAQSFRDLDRVLRPIVILLELTLVIFVAYRKVGNLREDKKKK